MPLQKLLLLLFFLPGVALGPGWELRICPQTMLGTDGCCDPTAPSCCAEEHGSPAQPVAENETPCAACCLTIATATEQPLPTPEQLVAWVSRAQQAALACAIQAPPPSSSELAPPAPREPERPPPGRSTPLPLLI